MKARNWIDRGHSNLAMASNLIVSRHPSREVASVSFK